MHISCAACGPPATPQPDRPRPLKTKRVPFHLMQYLLVLPYIMFLFPSIQHRVCSPIHHVCFPLYNIFSFPCMMVLFCHPKIGRALYTLYILPPVRSHPVAPLMFLCLEDRPTGTKSFVMDVGDGIGYQPNLTHGPPVRATPHPLNICGEV